MLACMVPYCLISHHKPRSPRGACSRYWCVPSSTAVSSPSLVACGQGHTSMDVPAQAAVRPFCRCMDTAQVMDRAADDLQESPIQLPQYFKGQMLGSVGSVELPALRAPSDQIVSFRGGVPVPGFSGTHMSACPLVGGTKDAGERISTLGEMWRESLPSWVCSVKRQITDFDLPRL